MSVRKIATSLKSIQDAIIFRKKKLDCPQKNLFEILKYKSNAVGTLVRKKKDVGFIYYKVTNLKMTPDGRHGKIYGIKYIGEKQQYEEPRLLRYIV
eukprot:gene7225-11540_t